MRENFKATVLVVVMFAASVFLIASFGTVAAVSQARIPSTDLGFIDKDGRYRIVGEVENIGDISLRFLQVNATFHDVDNNVIAYRSSYLVLDTLLMDRKAPFEIVLGNTTESALVHNYTLTMSYQEEPQEKPLTLQVMQSSSYIDDAGFQKVNGTVRNLASSNATNVRVVGTFYNDHGKVVGVSYGYTAPTSIEPGQTEGFDLELRYSAGDFSTYRLTVESSEFAAVTPALAALQVSLVLNATMVDSGTDVSVQVHVVNGTVVVKDAMVHLASNNGVFTPQAGGTDSNGDFHAIFTSPVVTSKATITITADATHVDYVTGQGQRQITVNPISQPVPPNWIYLAALVVVLAAVGTGVAFSRRKKHESRRRARARSHLLMG